MSDTTKTTKTTKNEMDDVINKKLHEMLLMLPLDGQLLDSNSSFLRLQSKRRDVVTSMA